MKKWIFAIALLTISLSVFSMVFNRPQTPTDVRTESAWYSSEKVRLEKALAHAEPGSPTAQKYQGKLARLEDWRRGEAVMGYPDEFARLLAQMRIPSDLTVAAYQPGYLQREMTKAQRMGRSSDKSLVWQSRGPGNVAGRAREILVDPDDPSGNTWFVASAGGGIWHTTDAGMNWTALMDDQPQLSTQSVAMAASNTSIMYAGSGESYLTATTMNGNGILKSIDKGASWQPLPSTVNDPRFNNVSRIIVSPIDPDLVLASTTVGRFKTDLYPTTHIFRSTDGGANWTEVFSETNSGTYDARVQQLLPHPTDFNIQYATVNMRGVLKSTDAGLSWNYINTGITDMTGRFELAISPYNPDYLFMSAQGASSSMLWASWNAGGSWTNMAITSGSKYWLGSQGYYDNAIVCHPTDPRVVFVGGLTLAKLTVNSLGGSFYTSTAIGTYFYPHPDHHDLVIVQPDGGDWYLLGTNDGGVARAATGTSGLTMPMIGMITTQFYGVDKCPGQSAYIGGMQDNGTWQSSVDPGAFDPWQLSFYGDGFETDWHFNDPRKLMGSVYFNDLWRSLDGGVSWIPGNNGLTDQGHGEAPFITKIGSSWQRPDDIFAVGAQGVWRSTNFGDSWALASVPLAQWGAITNFHDIRVSSADPDVVWAGGGMGADMDLMFSVNAGLTFSPATDYTAATMGGISGLATHPTEPATAYALFSFAERPKILRTTDLGASWTDISGFGAGSVSSNGFPDVAIYDLVVWPNDPQRIWVGTEIGLVESLDGGATWALANNGLPTVGIWFLKVVEDEIIIGTHGRGIWTMQDLALMDGLVFKPLVSSLAQAPTGDLELAYNLRSAYTATEFWVDGVQVGSIGPNTAGQQGTIALPVLVSKNVTAFVRSYVDSVVHQSDEAQATVSTSLLTPVTAFNNNLNDNGDFPFILEGLARMAPFGFTSYAIHSSHFYVNAAVYRATLTAPIVVTSNSTLSFDEIAMVEPGEDGAEFGYPGFWDYVVVEGSSDGVNWQAIAPGWDARDNALWLAHYNAGNSGTEAMYVNRSIRLSDTFATGEVVLLRWRLDSDSSVNGWGWAVDNIVVDPGEATAVDQTPRVVALAQNYPNPFNPETRISFNVPRDGQVKLQVFDTRGHLVRTLLDGHRIAGPYHAVWDGHDDAGQASASGVYLYRLTAGDETQQRKMTLVK